MMREERSAAEWDRTALPFESPWGFRKSSSEFVVTPRSLHQHSCVINPAALAPFG